MNGKLPLSSDAQIKVLKSKDKYYFESVNEAGLYIRVGINSSKSWYYIFNIKTVNGRRKNKKISLGKNYPTFSLLQAKLFAQTLTALRKIDIKVADIVKNGFTPAELPFHALTGITSQTLMDFGIKQVSKLTEHRKNNTLKPKFIYIIFHILNLSLMRVFLSSDQLDCQYSDTL